MYHQVITTIHDHGAFLSCFWIAVICSVDLRHPDWYRCKVLQDLDIDVKPSRKFTYRWVKVLIVKDLEPHSLTPRKHSAMQFINAGILVTWSTNLPCQTSFDQSSLIKILHNAATYQKSSRPSFAQSMHQQHGESKHSFSLGRAAKSITNPVLSLTNRRGSVSC